MTKSLDPKENSARLKNGLKSKFNTTATPRQNRFETLPDFFTG